MSVCRRFAADVETVATLMTEPDFIVDRCLAIGELSAECEAESTDKLITLHTRRVARHDLPGFLTRLVGETQTLTVEEVWEDESDEWRGHYTVRTAAAPIQIRGEFTLRPDGEGAIYTVRHSFRIPIPLIAGRIEKVLRKQITATVESELDYAERCLS